jgi:hypothetical protein
MISLRKKTLLKKLPANGVFLLAISGRKSVGLITNRKLAFKDRKLIG